MTDDKRLEMAVELQSYLFASSPPGFELLSSNWLERRMFGRENNKQKFIARDDANDNSSKLPKEYEFKDTRLVTTRDKELDKQRIRDWESFYDFDIDECGGHFNNFTFDGQSVSKRVQFADYYGQELFDVKISSESTDIPPSLKPETIKKIEQTLPGFTLEHKSSAETSTATNLNLKPVNFNDPHLDLLDLHNRVERLGVTLQSIGARQGRKVGGTIEIKKRGKKSFVYLRFTSDCWKTFSDVEANFVSIVGGTDHEMFAFEFEIPSHVHDVEFAVCHREDGSECWDNNAGLNYKISCHDDHDSQSGYHDHHHHHLHRTMSAPGDLTMWGVHDFEDIVQPYW